MNEHRYTLEPYKGMNTRYRCPVCQNKDKTFSLYIDTETGEHLHPAVGRCNRESKCGIHYTPKQYFQDNNISFDKPQQTTNKPRAVVKSKDISFISNDVFKASLKGFEDNYFINYLIDLFGFEVTKLLISKYFIASSKHWSGSTVFWQIDLKGKIRTGKIMLYSPTTGKRVKEPFNHIQWVHKAIKQPEFELQQCLFGEHLLSDKVKPIALCESEKTAIIASVYLPEFIWVAVGSLTNLTIEKFNVLKGRTVTLFPDLNGFDKWSNKAKELSHLAFIKVSDLLERKATEIERNEGLDLADYLIRFDYKEFIKPKPEPLKASPKVGPNKSIHDDEIFEPYDYVEPEIPNYENWERDITELEDYFEKATIPGYPVKLNQCSTIADCSLFVKSHLAATKANNGKKTCIPYLNRLQEFKTLSQSHYGK